MSSSVQAHYSSCTAGKGEIQVIVYFFTELIKSTVFCQLGIRGNVITFARDVDTFAKELPRLPKDVNHVILESDGKKKLPVRIRPKEVYEALVWLKKNNPYYADVTISEDNMAFYYANKDKDINFPTMKYAFDPQQTSLDSELPMDEKAHVL